jgi:aminopeptidase N
MKKILLLLLVTLFQFGYSQTYVTRLNKYDRINNYDVIHYKLDIKVDLDTKILGGYAYITLALKEPADSVSLDAENMKINKVILSNLDLKFTAEEKHLNIKLDKKYSPKDTLTLCVSYECNPGNSKGIKYFKPEPSSHDKNYQCWTQGEEELNHFWFPCYDFPNDRVTSEIIVTVKDNLETISNGKLISVKADKLNHTKTFHWLQDKRHVTYLVSLVVGEYSKVEDKLGDIPTPYYVYKGYEANAREIFPQTKDMISFYEKITGVKYPWAKYSQTLLQDFFGGMENTSATNLIDPIPDQRQMKFDEKYSHFYTTLIAHELAHMWYGDLLTCSNWSHLWLNEGFAEFLPGVYYENKYGKTVSDEYYIDELNSYLSIDMKDKMPTAEVKSNNIYPKGALIIKMIRDELGDKLFWKAIKDYTNKFRDKNVSTADFQKSIEESTGKDMSLFFRQWVYEAGYPKFKIKYDYDNAKRVVKFDINQIQKQDSLTGIFDVNAEIEIVTKNKTSIKIVHIQKEKENFEFADLDEPITVNFDPANKIIKEVEMEKPVQSYLYQLIHDKNISPRFEAAQKLKKYCDSIPVYETLKSALEIEKAIKVKTEIIRALGNSRKNETADILMKAFRDENPIIRRDVLFNLANFKSDSRVSPFISKALYDSSYSVVSSAVQNLVTVDSINAFGKITECLEKYSYGNTIQEHVLGALIKMKDERAIPYFMKYSINGVSQLARNSGLLGLVTFAKSHSELYDYFIKNINHENSYFRRMSINALSDIGNKEAVPKLKELQKTEKNPFVQKAIKDAIKKLDEK